jgi:hypothetical protein
MRRSHGGERNDNANTAVQISALAPIIEHQDRPPPRFLRGRRRDPPGLSEGGEDYFRECRLDRTALSSSLRVPVNPARMTLGGDGKRPF